MCIMHGNTYLVVAGSTRPNRRSPAVAEWVAAVARQVADAAFDVVDLRDLDLALDDEGGMPQAGGGYDSPATRAWSERVLAARGVVFVTPQYNWGYPAALKNAIDHLYVEWRAKPVLIVTYGGHGGDRCGAQLRQVMAAVEARPLRTMPALRLARAKIEANDGAVDPDRDFAGQRDKLRRALRKLVAQPAAG